MSPDRKYLQKISHQTVEDNVVWSSDTANQLSTSVITCSFTALKRYSEVVPFINYIEKHEASVWKAVINSFVVDCSWVNSASPNFRF